MIRAQRWFATLLFGALIVWASSAHAEIADSVLVNGQIYTVNKQQPWAEAIAIKGDKILFVGSNRDAQSYIGPATETIDLEDKMVLPGFVSGHDHLIASGWTIAGVNLFPAKSKEETLALVKEYADANPEADFIYGYGWNYTTLGDRPTAADLETVAPGRKIILFDFTIHDAWLSNALMEAGGIDKDTVDPQPGFSYWVRDEDGNPTGNSVELAWFEAYLKSGAWDREVLIPESQSNLYTGAAAQGWTSVINIGMVMPTVTNFEMMISDYDWALKYLQGKEADGDLKLRTFVQLLYKDPSASTEDLIANYKRLNAEYNTDMLRVLGIKIHPEANWGTHTSLMLEPYADKPDYRGIRGISAEKVDDIIKKSNAEGIDVSVHSDGSASIRATIDSIAASRAMGHSDERNSLQHFAVVHPDDMKRTIDMQIPVNITPIWRTEWGNSYNLAMNVLGKERALTYYQQLKTVMDGGNKVSISADVPSTPQREGGALFQLQAALTNANPNDPHSDAWPTAEGAVTLEQGIEALTIAPAWQTRMEDKIGSLEPGKYADLVILEENLFDVPRDEVADVAVLATIVGGKITFLDPNAFRPDQRTSWTLPLPKEAE